MTVSATLRRAGPFSGNGAAFVFPFSFKVFDKTDVRVILTDPNGNATVANLDSDYSVQLNADQDDSPGGSLTYPLSGAPMPSGNKLTILGGLVAAQSTDLTNVGRYLPQVVENAFDYAIILIQQLEEKMGRTLQAAPGSEVELVFPAPSAGRFLRWRADLLGLENAEAGTDSMVLQALLLDPTTGAGMIGFHPDNPYPPGTVGAALAASDGPVTSNDVTFQRPEAGSVQLTLNDKLVDVPPGLVDFGGAANGSSAVEALAAISDTVRIDVPVVASTTTVAEVADATFRGKGSLSGIYAKPVIPDNSASDELNSVGVVPGRHLRRFCTSASPVVVLVGDSLSTHFANSIARSDMLSEVLRTTLADQVPRMVFHNRAVGGMSFANFLGTLPAGSASWYTNPAQLWSSYVQALAPDLVIFAFGMNDSFNVRVQAMKDTFDNLQTWAKVPSIVVCTNLVPSPASTAFPEGQAGQEARDKAAGLIRSYTKFRGLGLVDLHRKARMVRDGYDPLSSIMTRGDTVDSVLSGSVYVSLGTRRVTDYKARVRFDSAAMSLTQWITLKTGPGVNDFVQFQKVDANNIRVSAYCGDIDSLAYSSINYAHTFPPGVGYHLVVEISGTNIVVYIDYDGNFGASYGAVVAIPRVALGSEFTPDVRDNAGHVLYGVDFSYGEQRVNVPSVKNSLLWGDGSSAIDVHGGSGWNHPGGFAASHIYRPVIQGIKWWEPIAPSGSIALASGITSITVPFPADEVSTAYNINYSIEGNDVGVRHWVQAKDLASFRVAFSGATTGPASLVWHMDRQY